METNLMQLEEQFHLKQQDLRSYSPLTLAYIGDGIYELIIRTILVKKGNCPVNQLHKKASALVKAASQSAIMEVIEEKLTQEEHDIYRRGRNAHSPTMAKHATMADYRRATGFEALMGYLYLKEDYTRMIAPRLRGPSTLSRRIRNGGSPFSSAFARISSTVLYSYAATWAITPWCALVSLS